MKIKMNKLNPEDGPYIRCSLTDRPTKKSEMVFQDGRWIRKEYADKPRKLIDPKK